MSEIKALQPNSLFRKCDPKSLGFQSTDEIDAEIFSVGQERASDAIDFGINITHHGYNLFVLGPAGMGKRDIVQTLFRKKAEKDPTPPDWIYVHNFKKPDQPETINLPAGMGTEYQQDIDELIDEMQTALSAAFESEEYQDRRQAIFESFKEKQADLFNELQEKADNDNLAMIKTPSGIAFAPKDEDGVLSPEEVNKLSKEEHEKIRKKIEGLQKDLQNILQQVPVWQREAKNEMNELNKEISNFAIGGLINELLEKYQQVEGVVAHIQQIQEQVVDNADNFLTDKDQEPSNYLEALSRQHSGAPALMEKFKVNLIIDNSNSKGAPVIFENNPTFPNLIGRVEHFAQMGALMTDFRMIKPGALHKANGGYLILDARKILTQPYAWEGIKRALQTNEIQIESIGQALSLISTVSLTPAAIPLNVKIALIGDRMLYYLLTQYDPEFSELFKIEADFETTIEWNQSNQELFSKLIATFIRKQAVKPFINVAVAKLIEDSARKAQDSQKLHTKLIDLKDLIVESNFFAEKADKDEVDDEDVQKAIDARIRRADRVKDKMQESILREISLISTDGEMVGQINGLSVFTIGSYSFGKPTRITAQVSLGKGQVLDIEREVDMGGPIHSKGVLILAGYLKGRYAQSTPLSLSASLVFEQSYGGVDGDSASCAELYALLSSIAEIPIKQSLAVTGSINQHGFVQAIGGVNEKIEGFFEICQARNLTGNQGVLIPESNIKHLMLHQDVVNAVEDGLFHIFPIKHADEGIELLTGLPMGAPHEDGEYPKNTINALVKKRLETMANQLAEFGKRDESTRE